MADHPAWKTAIQHAQLSDVGMRRSNNQDSHGVALAADEGQWRARGHLFMVADGLGAHAAGELASKLAVDNVPLRFHKIADLDVAEALHQAVVEANAEIHRRSQANEEFHNMGTTCSTLVLSPAGAIVAHVGDSRVYRLRSHHFEQLTFDHSLVWEMQAAGQLGEFNELARSIPKNVITRSLGPQPTVRVDVEGPHPIALGDTYLLCSDGLSGLVSDAEMGGILQALAPDEAVRALVDLANLRGGHDNITVVVAKVVGAEVCAADAATLATPSSPGDLANPRTLALGAAAGVAMLAGVACLALGWWSAGLVASLAGVALVGVEGLLRYTGPKPAAKKSGQPQLGRGPYRSAPCLDVRHLVESIADKVRELRSAAVEEDWVVDWDRADQFTSAADKALAAGDSLAALREYARCMSFVLSQLRKPRKKSSDSSIDLV